MKSLIPLILFLFASFSAQSEKPNIVIIFTDDQGYADLGCYGSKTNRTPRLDQLAREGTLFTSFYTQTVCGPSRSALLTGRYPCRSKGWGMPAEEITFAELIREAGYQTAVVGKWHLKTEPVGFDYYERLGVSEFASEGELNGILGYTEEDVVSSELQANVKSISEKPTWWKKFAT